MVVVFYSAPILRRESWVRKLIEVSRGAKLHFPVSFRERSSGKLLGNIFY